MIRKQFFIDEEENSRLKAAAVRCGESEGELIRQGVKQVLDQAAPPEEDWKVGLRRLKGMWADRTGIDEVMKVRREARRHTKERLLRTMGAGRK